MTLQMEKVAGSASKATGGTFAALRVPNFRLFLGGQIVSLCGTWMQTIALGWLVLSLGASGTALGLVTAAQFLPVLFFGPYGGLLADRTDRRRLLICTQVGSGLAALALGILDLTGTAQLWMVGVAAALIGLCNAIDNPARQSFVQEMVGPEHLPNAVTLNSVAINAARIVGPAIAGVVIVLAGTAGCFLINAASFGAVLFALHRMDISALYDHPPIHRAPGQLRAGFAYVRRTPALRVPLVMMVMIGTLSYEFQVVLPLLARETFGGTAATYSLMTSAMGAGAVVGGLLVARRRRIGPRALSLTAMTFGVILLLAAAAPTLPLEIATMVLLGATSVAFISTGNATVQLSADPAMRGRVMALWSVAFLGTTPVGGPIAGWVAQAFGARAGLLLAAGAAIGAALYAFGSLRATAVKGMAVKGMAMKGTAMKGTRPDPGRLSPIRPRVPPRRG
ncbi:arabinose efflux permease family protein [Frankia casuarinae]|jgi:MFS family permease|uniref:Major facilitator superfamily MFS_1 n=1 Tax=Frankia casuarinae (strain DSM 45818 / CECT 9043 / HFP020203 / CcI3) TaxID=106370 RepID=Q2J7A3_FRACC|nr:MULTISPECIES: MFS transporter [Frankia]ABD12839.1 major facilitator superfamily MFS_1 [Frankia casuarinae]ETA03295.1 arabinose efflux permease family protein [Frankia sp. CcI6]EYT92687.1 arabinose efflux permease family protein [Frankia casuarinae]KDA43622.1 arabinose efflux permease family protein [Frankia sp. BMG5.23]TFE26012.1 MFS transporter [Frankia sp. B2]